MPQIRPVLIDTDPGMDDAFAIILALKNPEIKVVGITVVAGNGSLTNMAANAIRCRSLLPTSMQDVPIFKNETKIKSRCFQSLTRSLFNSL